MYKKPLVSELRNYVVTTVNEAKIIATKTLQNWGLLEEVLFGLPEIDDRYHIWKVPLKSLSDMSVGTIYIDCKSGGIDEARSTTLETVRSRMGASEKQTPFQKEKKRVKKEYKISTLQNTLYHGDSEKVLDNLPDESVDLVFTSPPYFNARPQYNEYKDYDGYLDLMRSVIRKCGRVLIEGKFFVMNVSPVLISRASRNEASKRIAVPFDLHRIFIEEGFEFMEDIVWQKPEGAGWASGRGRRFAADRNPLQYKAVPVTENVLVYRKKSDKLIDWFIRNHPDKQVIEDSKIQDGYEKTNVWYISPSRDKRHPAVFPKQLASKVIQYYSFKNDVVLDPFAGLGTAGRAALDLGRRCYMIEKEDMYFEHMLKDFQEHMMFNEIIVKQNTK